MDDPIFAPAHELAAAIRRGEASSAKFVDAHLDHIERHNPPLNVVVTLDEDGARARGADAALDGGGVWGPPHGVPVTLEDAHPTAGVRSTWAGCPAWLATYRTKTGPWPHASRVLQSKAIV